MEEEKATCGDLLELEHKNPSSSSSAIDSTLLVCKEKKEKKKKAEEAPSKPTFAPLPRSRFLDKANDFLGVMAEANKKLEEQSKGNSEAFDIEVITGDETSVIEMNLMVGVADLNTPEAVTAAEAAIAGGNGLAPESDDSSSDKSDSDDEDDEKRSSAQGCSRKRTKIIELS